MREFDVDKKRFISESEGGFRLPEAKSDLCYRGRDVLLVGRPRDLGRRRAQEIEEVEEHLLGIIGMGAMAEQIHDRVLPQFYRRSLELVLDSVEQSRC